MIPTHASSTQHGTLVTQHKRPPQDTNTPLQVLIQGEIGQHHLQYALMSEEQWASALCAFVCMRQRGRNQTPRMSCTRTGKRFRRLLGLPSWDSFQSTPTFFDIQQRTRVGKNRSTVFETPILRCMRIVVFSLRRRCCSTACAIEPDTHDGGAESEAFPLDAKEHEHVISMSHNQWVQLLWLRALECVAVRRRISTVVLQKVFCMFVTSPHVWRLCRWSWLLRHTAFPHFFPAPWKSGQCIPYYCTGGQRDCNDHTWLVRLVHPRPGLFESKEWWDAYQVQPHAHSTHKHATATLSGTFAIPPSIIAVRDRKVACEKHALLVLQSIWCQCVNNVTSQEHGVEMFNHVLQPNMVCGKSQSTVWHWCAVRGWHALAKKLQTWCGVVAAAHVVNAYGVTPATICEDQRMKMLSSQTALPWSTQA